MKQELKNNNPYPVDVDLSNCDNEPIHLIPYVQHHACLIACELDTLRIIHASKNLKEKIDFSHLDVLGKPLEAFVDKFVYHIIKKALSNNTDFKQINPIRVGYEVKNRYISYNLLVHIHDQRLILEFEPFDSRINSTNYQYQLSQAIRRIQQAKGLAEAFDTSAFEIRKLTGYDRVMVYRFDDKGHGQVIAENKVENLESYLGLRYPASDIPKQARALFLINKVRITCDVYSESASIFPSLSKKDKKPLDLTHSVTRGVSPIHLEYLKNMGVRATLSISIEHKGKLWGMFACHNYTPKFIDYNLRTTCEFLGQILSGHLSLHAAESFRKTILKVNLKKSRLFEQMSRDWNIIQGLIYQEITILDLFESDGACIITEGNLVSLGSTPSETEIRDLVDWLDQYSSGPYFQTNELTSLYAPAKRFNHVAAGILAVKILPELSNYVIWFRKELVQEAFWAGNPNEKDDLKEEGMRLNPRKSFAKWKELVRNHSKAWKDFECEIALALRNDIKDFIYKKYQEVKSVNEELSSAYDELESFSYSVSHDLRAPLRNINGFAQILLEDYSEQLDKYGKEVIDTIVSSTTRMNGLINDILAFSKIGRTKLIYNELNLSDYASSIFNELILLDAYKKRKTAQLKIHNPDLLVYADAVLFKQLLQNLISNAVKYSSYSDAPLVEIGGKRKGNQIQFFVKDNGIGFNMNYKEQIFKVFTRLVNDKKFSGNGIGLAIVKRILDQHKGAIDINSEEGKGTTFYITLPILGASNE